MAEIRLIYAADSEGFARRMTQALAAEGYEVDSGAPSAARRRVAAASVVVWSPGLFDCEAGLTEARAALAARRLAPVSVGRVEAPASFAHLWPTDLAGWTGARDDPRWRFVLDEIEIAVRRAEEEGAVLLWDDASGEAEAAAAPRPAMPLRALALGGAVALTLAALAISVLLVAPRFAPQATSAPPRSAPAPLAQTPPAARQQGPALRDLETPADLALAAPRPPREVEPDVVAAAPERAEPSDDVVEILAQPDEPRAAGADSPGEDPAALLAQLPPAPADDFVGAVLRDCVACPDMVEIRAGAFVMGARDDDLVASAAERPARAVTIARAFAMTRRPVTFDDWERCVAGGGCRAYRPPDSGWGRGARPVINVSWRDAQDYVDWLSAQSGRIYRLPSEAEWEYAARAGADAPYAHGRTLSARLANFDGALRADGRDDVIVRMTTPAGSYAPNPFGLFDMHGNVWEIVAGCWTPDHANAPEDGLPQFDGDCTGRIAKGGSFGDPAESARASSRRRVGESERRADTGFRVARDQL